MHPFSRSSQPFEDPAIMSASFGGEHIFTPMTHGPPPGLPAPHGILSQQNDGEGESFTPYSQGREVQVPCFLSAE
jgi:hypothetical protein